MIQPINYHRYVHHITEYIILFVLFLIPFQTKAENDIIILKSTMPDVKVLTIATKEVQLIEGFVASGSKGGFEARIGPFNTVVPTINLAAGSNVSTDCTSKITGQYYVKKETYLSSSDNPITNTTIQYYDSFGNPFETIQVGATPNGADFISLVEFDSFGHAVSKWLPASIGGGFGCYVSPGSVKSGAQNLNNDSKPYERTIYEWSSLNRVVAQNGAGAAWELANRKTGIEYQTNGNDVFLYSISGNSLVKKSTNYPVGSLHVTRILDENNQVTYEYKDKSNQVVLKRAVAEAGNHDTYYVYDNFGLLRYVLSPEASSRMTANTTYSSAGPNTANNPLDQCAFIYVYDTKGRCIKKKLPGADWIYMVYDAANRLILTQDGNQRSKSEWSFSKYDVMGRVIQTGITTIVSSHSSLQSSCAGVLFVESYNVNTHSYTSNPGFLTNYTVLTQNFYDIYDFPSTFPSDIKSFKPTTGDLSTFDTKYENIQNNIDLSAKGLLTGTEVAMLDNPTQKICTVLFYNDKGQPVQTLSSNHLGGFDNDFFAYNFTGQPLKKRHVHSAYLSDPAKKLGPVCEDLTFAYDHAGRLTDTYHSLMKDNVVYSNVNLCSLKYDELGRVINKTLHGGLQSINLSYNVRSWLKSINSPVFSETLYYQDPTTGATAQYNGNISAIKWGNNGTQDKQYAFTYDKLNRLKKASYTPDEVYNEEVGSYDRNGNINTIKRKGYVHQTTMTPVVGDIDNLTLSYSGNQLVTVRDSVSSAYNLTTNDFKDQSNGGSSEYLYDGNGNMTADFNKSIAWIKYNSLNLPSKIQFMNGNKTEYLYDASGVKREAKYSIAVNSIHINLGDVAVENTGAGLSLKSKTDYCGSYIYENDTIKKLLTSEGYIQAEGATPANSIPSWKYTYFVKDHLDNTRAQLAYAINGGTTQTLAGQTDYYPFGMEISAPEGLLTSGKNPYLYNGKEVDRMNGVNMYDYGARWYDPAIGRWGVVDNKAEKFYPISTYVYGNNNPIRFIDPDGNTIVDANNKEITYTNENGWSDNATDDVRLIGDAMMRTPKGKEMFFKMMSSKTIIDMHISQTDRPSQTDGPNNKDDLGNTEGHRSESGQDIGSATITIYVGAITRKLKILEEQRKELDNGVKKFSTEPNEKTSTYLKYLPSSVIAMIGAVAGHEGEHATNKNASELFEPSKPIREDLANKPELEILRQMSKLMPKPIQPISVIK